MIFCQSLYRRHIRVIKNGQHKCSAALGLVLSDVSDFCRAKISELAKSGLILVDLRATITGELYGDTVWRFSQLPRPARQPPAAAAQLPLQPGTKGNQGRHAKLRPKTPTIQKHVFTVPRRF